MHYDVMVSVTSLSKLKQIAREKSVTVGEIFGDALSVFLVGLAYKRENTELLWLEKNGDDEQPFFVPEDSDTPVTRMRIQVTSEINRILTETSREQVTSPESIISRAVAVYIHGWLLHKRYELCKKTGISLSQPTPSSITQVLLSAFE